MTLDELKQNCNMSMDDIKEFVKQTAYVIDEKWDDYPSDDEEWSKLANENYPMADPDDSWKGWYIDIGNALLEIDHPQSNELSKIFYRQVFISSERTKYNMKLILNTLKSNPMEIVSDIKLNETDLLTHLEKVVKM